MTTISLVLPCHHEAPAIPKFLATVMPILEQTGCQFEVLFVDDDSTDATVAVLLDHLQTHPQIRVIELSRNFGKQAAMTAIRR